MKPEESSTISFDEFAEDYDAALEKGISVSGEDKNFFAKARVDWLASCLANQGIFPKEILDFGCGTGSAIPHMLQAFENSYISGVEVSAKSIEVARSCHVSERVNFFLMEDFQMTNRYDLVFCNGVFHHIPIPERQIALKKILNCLRAGGIFAFWENNPWNPGTRVVMSRIPFDRDAQTLSPISARRMIQSNGFQLLQMDFRFYFPRSLSFLRFTEKILTKIPLGAQYQILAMKPKEF